jgi:DNA-binding HxlR family transcriptional regulator
MEVYGMIKYRSKDFNCPLEFALDLISGRWKARIIWFLRNSTRRFGELGRLMPDTARKVLVEQLKELEADGLISRTVYDEVPPKVEYALTEPGQELVPILEALRGWGKEHAQQLNLITKGDHETFHEIPQKSVRKMLGVNDENNPNEGVS